MRHRYLPKISGNIHKAQCRTDGARQASICRLSVRPSSTRSAQSAQHEMPRQRTRIDAPLPLAERYSDLNPMGVEDLRDQLKKHTALGKDWFLGVPGELHSLRTAARDAPSCSRQTSSTPTTSTIVTPLRSTWATSALKLGGGWMPLRWRPSSARLSLMVSRPTPSRAKQCIVLYRIVWMDYAPDRVWYEPGENLGSELLQQYEQSLPEEAAADHTGICQGRGRDLLPICVTSRIVCARPSWNYFSLTHELLPFQ
eukprot:6179514-Pleurochrysis_carterae.AAC.1